MESPLNKAHQWSRKADALSAAGKYEEAVACHNRAAENMLETLQSPVLYDNPSLVSCLRQQHEHHLRQVKILQNKQSRKTSMEAHKSQRVTTRNKAVQTSNPVSKMSSRCAGSGHDSVLINNQNIEESMREADTLLHFLKRRKEDPKAELLWETFSAEIADNNTEEGIVAVKKPKDDKDIIEELRCLTGELQLHIKQLVQETERLKTDKQQLSNQLLQQGESSVNGLPLDNQCSMSSSFTLPPLEIPSLQPKMSSDSEDDLSDRV